MPTATGLRRADVWTTTRPTIMRHVDRSIALFTPAFFAARDGQGCRCARPDLHPRHAARRIDAGRANPLQPSGRSRARPSSPTFPPSPGDSTAARRAASRATTPNASPSSTRDATARARRGISRAHARPALHRPAVLHRQAAEQLGACRPDPADPAQRQDHRRPAPSARLRLFQLQAALCARPALLLRPGGHRRSTIATMCR